MRSVRSLSSLSDRDEATSQGAPPSPTAGAADNNFDADAKATTHILVTRSVRVPDPLRVNRCARLPEYGPRIVFLTGGTALRPLSSVLKRYTHRSIHLVTPFDSGGSSAELRRAFGMPAVGDLRNRLMALADDGVLGNPEVAALFSYRLHPTDKNKAWAELAELLSGSHPLLSAVSPPPMRSILSSHLRWCADRLPPTFNPRSASVGNLVLAGCYLEHGRDIGAAVHLVTRLVGVRGVVRPIASGSGASGDGDGEGVDGLHVRAWYGDGTSEVGQHHLGRRAGLGTMSNDDHERRRPKIVRIDLVKCTSALVPSPSSTDGGVAATELGVLDPAACEVDPTSAAYLRTADLIVYPMGSVFGSVLVNLLPQGVGCAITQRKCPKIYIPNAGRDPEMVGYTIAGCCQLIVDMVRSDPGAEDAAVEDILQYVLIDTEGCEYGVPIDREGIEHLGVTLLDLPLAEQEEIKEELGHGMPRSHEGGSVGVGSLSRKKASRICPKRLAEVLLSFG